MVRCASMMHRQYSYSYRYWYEIQHLKKIKVPIRLKKEFLYIMNQFSEEIDCLLIYTLHLLYLQGFLSGGKANALLSFLFHALLSFYPTQFFMRDYLFVNTLEDQFFYDHRSYTINLTRWIDLNKIFGIRVKRRIKEVIVEYHQWATIYYAT